MLAFIWLLLTRCLQHVYYLCRRRKFLGIWPGPPLLFWMDKRIRIQILCGNQNPSLLLSLDLSTYSWMWVWSTGSSTTSLVLKETYRLGSKSAGLCLRAPLADLHLSISESCINKKVLWCIFGCRGAGRFCRRRGQRWCWCCHRDRRSSGRTLDLFK